MKILYLPSLALKNTCYKVDVWKDEFVEYLWEQKVGVTYKSTNYYLYEPKGLYKKLENDWWNNKINEEALLNDQKFIEWLQIRYCD